MPSRAPARRPPSRPLPRSTPWHGTWGSAPRGSATAPARAATARRAGARLLGSRGGIHPVLGYRTPRTKSPVNVHRGAGRDRKSDGTGPVRPRILRHRFEDSGGRRVGGQRPDGPGTVNGERAASGASEPSDQGSVGPPQPEPDRSLRVFDRHLRPLTIILWSIARTTGPPAVRVVTGTRAIYVRSGSRCAVAHVATAAPGTATGEELRARSSALQPIAGEVLP